MLSQNLLWSAGKAKEHEYRFCPAGPPLSLLLPHGHMTYWPTHLCFLCWLGFRAVSQATLFSYAWVRSDNASPFPPLPSSAYALGCACLFLFICCSCDVIRHGGSGAFNETHQLWPSQTAWWTHWDTEEVVIGQCINTGRLESGYFEIIVLAD